MPPRRTPSAAVARAAARLARSATVALATALLLALGAAPRALAATSAGRWRAPVPGPVARRLPLRPRRPLPRRAASRRRPHGPARRGRPQRLRRARHGGGTRAGPWPRRHRPLRLARRDPPRPGRVARPPRAGRRLRGAARHGARAVGPPRRAPRRPAARLPRPRRPARRARGPETGPGGRPGARAAGSGPAVRPVARRVARRATRPGAVPARPARGTPCAPRPGDRARPPGSAAAPRRAAAVRAGVARGRPARRRAPGGRRAPARCGAPAPRPRRRAGRPPRRQPRAGGDPAASVHRRMSAFYVTTPIYYVNAAPHLGHAYTTIVADVLARHHRQRGEDVFFLTGTDEHGEPVADAAKAQGLEPRELADRNAERFKALMPRLAASNDFFIRTSDEQHGVAVQEVLQRVHDNGHVFKGLYEGWYCPRCADFKVENEIAEGNRCPIHEIPLVRQSEENWFFRLSTFQEPLERLYAEQPDFVLPRERRNEALAFIQSGLQDISLSRGKLTWGVTVPVGPDARLLRVVRRAPELLHGAVVRPSRRGPDRPLLARAGPPHRQGHPEVPHRLLAGDAARRRPPAARARLRPRLPARRRRAQDEQVARERPGPVRGHRPLRGRRAALLPPARRRPGRRRLGVDRGRRAAATRASWPTTTATWPAAPSRCCTATATASSRPGRRTPASRPTSTPCRTASPSSSTATRSRRPSRRSGSGCAA